MVCLDSLMCLRVSGRKDELCKETASLDFDFTLERFLFKHVRIYERWHVV